LRRWLLLFLLSCPVLVNAQIIAPQLVLNSPSVITVNRILHIELFSTIAAERITYSLNNHNFNFRKSQYKWQSSELITAELCPPGIYQLQIFIPLTTDNDLQQAHYLMQQGSAEIVNNSLYLSRQLVIMPEQADPIAVKISPQPAYSGQLLTVVATVATLNNRVTLIAGSQQQQMEHLDGFDYLLQIRAAEQIKTIKIYALTVAGELLSSNTTVEIYSKQKSEEISPVKTHSSPVTKDYFEIRGEKSIAFSSYHTSGDAPLAKNSERREETLQVFASGREDGVSLESELYITDQELQDDNDLIKIKLFTNNWELFWGDYLESIGHSSLTLQDKQLKGLSYLYRHPQSHMKVAVSRPAGSNYQEYIYGNNSQGPFQLRYTSLVIHSEIVSLLGKTLTRGLDYHVDYGQGRITLINNILRKEESLKISYQYQAQNYRENLNYLVYEYHPGNLIIRTAYIELLQDQRSSVNSSQSSRQQIYSTAVSINQGDLGLYLENNFADIGLSDDNSQARDLIFSYSYQGNSLKINSSHVGFNYPTFGNAALEKGLDCTGAEINSGFFYLDHQQRNYLVEKRRELEHLSSLDLDYFSWLHRQQSREYYLSGNILSREYNQDQLKLSYPITANSLLGIGGGRELLQDDDFQKESSNGLAFIKISVDRQADFYAESKLYHIRETSSGQLQESLQHDDRWKLTLNRDQQLRLNFNYLNSFNSRDGIRDVLSFDLLNNYLLSIKSSYQIESLNEQFSDKLFRIRKDSGVFTVSADPWRSLRLKYNFKPRTSFLVNEDNRLHFKNLASIYSADLYLWSCSWQYQFFRDELFNRDLITLQTDREYLEQSNNLLLRTELGQALGLELYQELTSVYTYQRVSSADLSVSRTDSTIRGLNTYWRLDPRLALLNEYRQQLDRCESLTSGNTQTSTVFYSIESHYQLTPALQWRLSYALSESQQLGSQILESYYTAGSGIGYRLNTFSFSIDWQNNCGTLEGKESIQEQLTGSLSYNPQPLINLLLNFNHNNYLKPYHYQYNSFDLKLVLKF